MLKRSTTYISAREYPVTTSQRTGVPRNDIIEIIIEHATKIGKKAYFWLGRSDDPNKTYLDLSNKRKYRVPDIS